MIQTAENGARPSRRGSTPHANHFRIEVEACVASGKAWIPEAARDVPDLEVVMPKYIEHRSHRLRPTTVRRYTENVDLFRRFL